MLVRPIKEVGRHEFVEVIACATLSRAAANTIYDVYDEWRNYVEFNPQLDRHVAAMQKMWKEYTEDELLEEYKDLLNPRERKEARNKKELLRWLIEEIETSSDMLVIRKTMADTYVVATINDKEND